jgi:hypothetical protein
MFVNSYAIRRDKNVAEWNGEEWVAAWKGQVALLLI